MILIFGGAYQGKLEYALTRYKLCEGDIYRCSDESSALPCGKKIICDIDKWVLALIDSNEDVTDAAKKLIDKNPDSIVICTDITCGVVPVDARLRAWREAVGRLLASLAHYSDEVYRLFCAIPTQIK